MSARCERDVDEARHDRRVARVDHFARRRQHAAPHDRSDPSARDVDVDVSSILCTHGVEQPPDLNDVVLRRGRRRPADVAERLRVRVRLADGRVGRCARGGFGADLEANAAHGAGRSRRDSQRQRLAVGPPARPSGCEPGSDGRDAPGLRDLRDGEALARAGPLGLRFDERDSTPVAAHRRMSWFECAECDLTRGAAAKVDAPELELTAALAREHERSAIGRERGIEVHPDVVREPAQRPALGKPQVA